MITNLGQFGTPRPGVASGMTEALALGTKVGLAREEIGVKKDVAAAQMAKVNLERDKADRQFGQDVYENISAQWWGQETEAQRAVLKSSDTYKSAYNTLKKIMPHAVDSRTKSINIMEDKDIWESKLKKQKALINEKQLNGMALSGGEKAFLDRMSGDNIRITALALGELNKRRQFRQADPATQAKMLQAQINLISGSKVGGGNPDVMVHLQGGNINNPLSQGLSNPANMGAGVNRVNPAAQYLKSALTEIK